MKLSFLWLRPARRAALRVIFGLLLFVMSFGLVRGAVAQTPDVAGSEHILQKQEEYLRLEEEERRRRFVAPPADREEKADEKKEGKEGGMCFVIKHIKLSGQDRIRDVDPAGVLEPFEGRCIGLAEIDLVMRDLTDLYVRAGYITTRVYVPKQDLGSGTLELILREGILEDFVPGSSRLGTGNMATAFPGMTGKVLNLRDLEQGLDQINRLSRYNIKMSLQPGVNPGGTSVHLGGEAAPPWSGGFTVDNSGSRATGSIVGTIHTRAEDLLGLNDQWSLQWRHSPVPRDSSGRSESLSGSFSIPWGYSLLSLSSNWFNYDNPIRGLRRVIRTRGQSRTNKVRLDHVVHRDSVSKTILSGSLAIKDTVNYIENLKIRASSRRLVVGSCSLTHSRRFAGGALLLSAGYDAGLDRLGAEKDRVHDPRVARAQFRKYVLDVQYQKPLPSPVDPIKLDWTTSAHGQWTPHTLYGQERLSIGSRYSVRGFQDQGISGDRGGYLRNDFRLTFPPSGLARLDQLVGRSYLTFGYDIGAIRSDNADAMERGVVGGVSAAFGVSGGPVTGSLSWSRPVRAPSFIKDRSNTVYFSVGVSI